MAPPVDLVVDVARSPAAVSAARREASWWLAGRAPVDVDAAGVVIGELLANALQHTPGPIRLRLEVSDDHVRVQVHDALPHMVPGTLVGGLVPRPSGDRPAGEGGRGLILVAGLSDSWGVDSDGAGKVVWADLSAAGGW